MSYSEGTLEAAARHLLKCCKSRDQLIELLRKTFIEVQGCQKSDGTPALCDGCLISINKALAEIETFQFIE